MANNTVNYGPLEGFIGSWSGNKGLDIAPDKNDIKEENPYYETITFEGAGYANNAEKQLLAAVRYHQVVRRKSDDQVFHDQTGYWMWDKAENTIMQSIVIPRGLALLAGGEAKKNGNAVTLNVSCDVKDDAWSVVQSPFMHKNAKTTAFKQTMTLNANTIEYSETTMLEIYGGNFEHIDANVLTRNN